MLTPEDLRNPERQSGFRNVQSASAGPNGGGQGNYWRGITSKRGFGGQSDDGRWRGPMRHTPEEAAQDVANHLNGQPVAPASMGWRTPSVDMGNVTQHSTSTDPVRVVRTPWTGPTDLYDVLIYTHTGALVCRKVGITARGTKRYEDICKTFGISIKPHQEAVTYPTKQAATDAEAALIAEVCKDDQWERIGKESFARKDQTQ